MTATPPDGAPGPGAALPFALRVGFDQPELLGASWWQERLLAGPARAAGGVEPSRRQALQVLLAMGGFAAVGVAFAAARCSSPGGSRMQSALALQQAQGLAVDATGVPFLFPDPVLRTCDGSLVDDAVLRSLAATLRPRRAELQPCYVPTLFQSLAAPSAGPLRETIRPMHNEAMARAEARGAAVRELLAALERPGTQALVVDLPGPEALSFAAGLAPEVDVVCSFDNWPHPRGVVPSHLTLAAALYWAPRLAQGAPDQAPRPLCLVLDRDRLRPYANEADRFDNRYLARLPDAATLRALGVERVLYVAPEDGPAQEADDLNDEFVDYRGAGLVVQLLGAGDLRPAATTAGSAGAGTGTSTSSGNRYYWHGSPGHHWWFWSHYGAPHRPGPLAGVRPDGPVFGAGYQPTPRASPFAGRSAGGIGLVPDRSRSSSSSSRRGSWGRTHGFTGS